MTGNKLPHESIHENMKRGEKIEALAELLAVHNGFEMACLKGADIDDLDKIERAEFKRIENLLTRIDNGDGMISPLEAAEFNMMEKQRSAELSHSVQAIDKGTKVELATIDPKSLPKLTHNRLLGLPD